MSKFSPDTTNRVPNDERVQTLRYHNLAVLALDELYEAAVESPGAREELRAEADRLVRRAGQWRDTKNAFKGRGK